MADIPDDDPFLPARDAKVVQCPTCGETHRDDHGCPTIAAESQAGAMVLFAAIVAVAVLGAAVIAGLIVGAC